MPVSGLVITLCQDEALCLALQRTLAGDTRITLGEANGPRLPIVSDTGSTEEDEEVWEWLRSLPGVDHLDLVCVDFSDVEQFETGAGVLGMRGRLRPKMREHAKSQESRS